MKRRYIFLIIIITLIFSSLYFYGYFKKSMRTYNKTDIYFVIKEGDSLNKVANSLYSKGIIRSKGLFTMYARFKNLDTQIKSGNYIIPSGIRLDELMQKITSGKSDYAIITIPEGYNIYQIAQKLEKSGLMKKEDLLNAKISDYDKENLMGENKNVFYELEGYLFPDTYYIPFSMKKDEIIQLLFDEFVKNYNENFRKRAKELGLKTNEVITIASLIEKEAANDQERKRIAGVIYNRLRLNMPLQIDATVIYGITKGEKNIQRLHNKDYQYDSNYNTYKFAGLPPGPIACPGIKSIEAALYPEMHDYLYYVYSGNGHVFSKTYQEHIKNVHKYIK